MKLIYAGTPPFAALALDALLTAGHEVGLVLTQPDRPAGRGLKTLPSAVKAVALQHGLAVAQPTTLRDPDTIAQLRAIGADAMVVAAYGLILPADVLAIPRHGCINIHASLLPRWRGAAPIQRAILAGDAQTGISIMQMDAGLDTGPILLQEAMPITPHDTAQTLHDKLAALGATLVVRALANPVRPRAQDPVGATYAAKIDKREAMLDWRDDAAIVDRKVRAFNPVPGALTALAGEPLKIWAATPAIDAAGAPGTVLAADAAGIVVGCGRGALRVTELQRAGAKRLNAAAFLAGTALPPGTQLGS
ncbi:MAG: methionyl-tRNA formyltransferase [Rhodospirillaceae bacterium]